MNGLLHAPAVGAPGQVAAGDGLTRWPAAAAEAKCCRFGACVSTPQPGRAAEPPCKHQASEGPLVYTMSSSLTLFHKVVLGSCQFLLNAGLYWRLWQS